MPKDDVKRALEAMIDDPSLADAMAAGDFSGVDGLDLSDDEQTLVKDAAADMPEVAGFASDYLLNFYKEQKADFGIKGELQMKWPDSPAMNKALKYLKI